MARTRGPGEDGVQPVPRDPSVMLTDDHLDDIRAAMAARGWTGPTLLPLNMPGEYDDGSGTLAEVQEYRRGEERIRLFFVADPVFRGAASVTDVYATAPSGEPGELWLHRRRDSKWKKELIEFADRVAGRLPTAQ